MDGLIREGQFVAFSACPTHDSFLEASVMWGGYISPKKIFIAPEFSPASSSRGTSCRSGRPRCGWAFVLRRSLKKGDENTKMDLWERKHTLPATSPTSKAGSEWREGSQIGMS